MPVVKVTGPNKWVSVELLGFTLHSMKHSTIKTVRHFAVFWGTTMWLHS